MPERGQAEPEQPDLRLVIGARLDGRGPLRWFRADGPDLAPGAWVVVDEAGQPRPALVAVGTGQCLQAAFDPLTLPFILRRARPDELPERPDTAGRRLLESLPLERDTLEVRPPSAAPPEA